jgi:hypothetical protein
MPVIYQKRIHRDDLQANPDSMYLFGDNDNRTGLGGQAGEMRGEDNAIGVRTKWAPGMSKNDFFSDKDFDDIAIMIEEDMQSAIEHLEAGGILVVPLDGLGTGLSELPRRAPRINEFLSERLQELERVKAKRA